MREGEFIPKPWGEYGLGDPADADFGMPDSLPADISPQAFSLVEEEGPILIAFGTD